MIQENIKSCSFLNAQIFPFHISCNCVKLSIFPRLQQCACLVAATLQSSPQWSACVYGFKDTAAGHRAATKQTHCYAYNKNNKKITIHFIIVLMVHLTNTAG